ncbi:MAG TPA: hypothetical protein VGJ84_15295 [Polyangiaceae bacterium]
MIDIVDNSQRHQLVGLNALFDLPDSLDLRGQSAIPVVDRLERVSREAPWVDIGRIEEAGELAHITERIDLFKFEPPAEIALFTNFAWCAAPDGGYRLNLADGEWVGLHPDNLGRWIVVLENPRGDSMRMPAPTRDLFKSVRAVDELVRRHRSNCVAFLTIDAGWRANQPTDKQLGLLRRHGVPTPSGLTRGQASWMIAMLNRLRTRS